MTKKEIIVALKETGVKFNAKAGKEELEALLQAATAGDATEQAADAAGEEAKVEEPVEEKAEEEQKPAAEEKKSNRVVYSNYTSKKNLLKDYPNMETENNQTKIFHNGFTYSITEDRQYIAVTYYYSKGAFYKYGLAKLNENMQVDEVAYKDSIKEVKAAIKDIYHPAPQVTEEPAAEEEEA